METDSIRITVLMSIYNCTSTLEEALDSLMNQTYQGFKVVLCDDCSTDNTYETAEKYVAKYPDKFILIRNETNMKLPATLNRCLEYADTEFIARMDGDDISKPERFEKELEFLDNNKEFSFVSCPMEYFDENGIFMTGKVEAQPNKYSFLKGSPFAHAAVMIRTKDLRNVGGYTVAKWTQRGQDYHLWAKMYGAGFKGYNLSNAYYQMRDDQNATKRRKRIERFRELKRMYEIYKLLDLPMWNLLRGWKSIANAFAPEFVYTYFHKRRFSK